MRIAISGTHCCGKSTLVEAFLRGHQHYQHEPEAYEALEDLYGETFAAEPSADEFYQQLEYQLGRLAEYRAGERVIFERSPLDYIAYLQALGELGRAGASEELTEQAHEVAPDAIRRLDLIVYLPLEGELASAGDVEDPKLRWAVDERLAGILLDDDLGLFTTSRPKVIEARGTTPQRLRTVESALLIR